MAGRRRQSIEVFRLRLRETVNEGSDDGGSARSLLSLQEEPSEDAKGEKSDEFKADHEKQQRQEKQKKRGKQEKQERQEKQEKQERQERQERQEKPALTADELRQKQLRQERRQEERRRRRRQHSRVENPPPAPNVSASEEEEDIDGRSPEKRRADRKARLIASLSSGGDSSSRTLRCSLDGTEGAPVRVDTEGEDEAEANIVRAIEDVAQLAETLSTTTSTAALSSKQEDNGSQPPLSESHSPGGVRASRRVVLVTRPSQRDIEQWTERATSTMVKSTGSGPRPTPTSAQSRRWVLEYKPVVRHSGWLIKRGHSLRNFKRRLFCIVDNELIYHDAHDATEVRGRVDLNRKSTVQCLLHSGFKFSQGTYSMVLYALDKHDRDVWIRKLQELNVELLPETSKTTKLIKQQSDNADNEPILFSGWLRKRGRMVKSTKRRWFELSSSTLSYFSHPQGGSRKGSIDVSHARASALDTLKTGERHSFQISTPSRTLYLHADSQEERALWLASLASVSESGGSTAQPGSTTVPASNPDAAEFAMPTSASEIGRMCKCGALAEEGAAIDGCCRRCMSSFIGNTEEPMVDVAREVQLLLESPYSPEGCTSAAFLKEHTGRAVANATVREFMSGLADYTLHTRMKELLLVAGVAQNTGSDSDDTDDDGLNDPTSNAITSAATSEMVTGIQNVVYEKIEERVFFPLYRTIVANVHAQTREDAKVLKGKIEILRGKSQAFFGIGPDSVSPSSWATACAKLRDVDTVSLPYMKRAQLLAACKEIYAVFHTEHPTEAPMSADAFIPAFIFVLIHSHLRDPVALKELITFFDAGSTQGEIAYFVTCLEIALEYIRSLLTACTVVLSSARKLGIEFAKHPEADVVVVNRLVPGEQAQQSGAIEVGDVLVALNGLPVYEMELDEVVKLWKGVDGEAEFCFLPMHEYLKKYGTS